MTFNVINGCKLLGAALVAGAMMAPVGFVHAEPGEEGWTLELVEISTAFHTIDVPARAADGAAGDIGTFESNMVRDGVVVGTLAGHCIQLRADGTLDNCDVVLTIGSNSVHLSGLFDPAKGGTLAIVGGTGAWAGAAGTDTIVNQADGTAVHKIRFNRHFRHH